MAALKGVFRYDGCWSSKSKNSENSREYWHASVKFDGANGYGNVDVADESVCRQMQEDKKYEGEFSARVWNGRTQFTLVAVKPV